MSANLIDLFKNSTGDPLIRRTSVFLGESAQSISSSLDIIVPALLGTIIIKANSEAGVRELIQFISANNLDDLSQNNTAILESDSGLQNLVTLGPEVLKYLVDDKLNVFIDWISGASPLKTSSSNTLLRILAPLLLRFIARIKSESSFKASDLKDYLGSESGSVNQSTPKALGDLLGFSFLATPKMGSSTNVSGQDQVHDLYLSTGKLNYLPWLILLLVSLGLFYFLQHGFNSKFTSSNEASNGMGADSISYELKNGGKISATPNSFTALMLEYINGNDPAGKCMTLDKVTFETGNDQITVQSFKELLELKAILSGSPGMNIVITAYSDHAGDDDSKQVLSDQRAEAVKHWLMLYNVAANQIQTKGMGEAKPISSDKDEADQEMKKIVEVCIVKKG